MTLVNPADIQALVPTDLDVTTLSRIISDVEAEMIRRLGAHGDGVTSVSETYSTPPGVNLFLRRAPLSVTTVQERVAPSSSLTTVSSSYYLLWADEARIERHSGTWGAQIVVTYVPADDRARRRPVIIELVRLALSQTALAGENVAGEYSYTAPDWEARAARLFARLEYRKV